MGLFIHLGAHKTATTHLARSIQSIEQPLRGAGIRFLGPDVLRQPPIRLRSLLADPDARPRDRRATAALLRDAAARHHRLILSEEQILGGLIGAQFLGEGGQVYPMAGPRLQRLMRLLGTSKATLLLAIRSPADFLTSAFGEALRHGGPLRIETYLDGFDPAALRWSDLIVRLQAEAGASRIMCWRYEDLTELRAELLSLMVGAELAPLVPDLRPTRMGMSDAAYRALLEQSAGPEADRAVTGALRKAHPKRRHSDGLRVFSGETLALCDRLYHQDCARIATLPGVTMLAPQGQGGARRP